MAFPLGAREAAATAPEPEACVSLQCGNNSRCAQNDSGVYCECLDGFQKLDGACEDIDECALDERGGCSEHADCNNTVGGRTCTCRAEYEDERGDGTVCTHVCELADCLPDVASCAVVDGVATCSCLPAYQGDGVTACEPKIECSQLGCDPQTERCEATSASWQCVCRDGYERTSGVCADADDCSPNPCQNGGTCTDGIDSFSCSCADGYEGDRCETRKTLCAENPCQNGGTCVEGAAGYTCSCTPGYAGATCQTDVDECAENGRSECGTQARCSNKSGGRDCIDCSAGDVSSSDGLACVSVDECAAGTHKCGAWSGACSAGAGVGYDCQCAAGFVDSGGTFPQCYKSGTLRVVDGSDGATFDVSSATVNPCCTEGDFYVLLDSQSGFWANNIGQRGVVQVDVLQSTPLLEVEVPSTGYSRFGVPIVDGATYVSYAQDPEEDYYIVFRVASLGGSSITLDYVYVYRP